MNKPIFIDFEASSIQGFPIQVAYGTCEKNLKCLLIKPLDIWNNDTFMWDYNAEDMHGFSKEYLNQHGIDAALVARQISGELKNKTIYADNGIDLNWLFMLFDDVAEHNGESYIEPGFQLISKLYYQLGISSDLVMEAQVQANKKFRDRGLVAHQADADALKHIWTWEAIKKKKGIYLG